MDAADTKVLVIAFCMKELTNNTSRYDYICHPTSDPYTRLFHSPSNFFRFIRDNYEGYNGITNNEYIAGITEEELREKKRIENPSEYERYITRIIDAFKLFVRFLIEHDSINKEVTGDLYIYNKTYYLDRLRDKFFSSPSRTIQAIIQEVAPGVYHPSKFVIFGSRKHGIYVKNPVRSALPASALPASTLPVFAIGDPLPVASALPASALPASTLPVFANGDPLPVASARSSFNESEPLLNNVGGRRTARKHRKRRNHRKSRKHRK